MPRPPLPIPDTVLDIARRLEGAGYETWCVGGAVRDHLLGDANADFDLATRATPDEVRKLFRRTVDVGIEFGTVGVLDAERKLHEVTTFRRDVSTDGRRAVVAFGATLEEDLARRDFTINAIAYHPLHREWRDPFDGFGDLDRKLVRAVGQAEERFREDYLRILRGVRFAARFGFKVEPATWAAALAAAPGLDGLSAERVREEWFKSLRTTRSLPRLVELWRAVIAPSRWMPELHAAAPRDPGADFPRDPVLLTAFLAEGPARLLERLKASRAEIDRAAAISAGPAAPAGSDDVAIRRWLSAVTPPVAADLAALHALRTGHAPGWEPVMRRILDRGDPIDRGALAVTGADLLDAGIPKGPALGRVLKGLLDFVLEDPTRNTREALLRQAKALS
ncbi:MAG TPA: CCA tRNA nucleotidyltransferase [Gemmatimonadales bacterium]|nr:CCA tRNA nucleotidyltransferase [Gemmatimonadales bacterium]